MWETTISEDIGECRVEIRTLGRGAVEEIVLAADAEPAVAVGFEEDEVAAGGVGAAVVVGDDVGEMEVELL